MNNGFTNCPDVVYSAICPAGGGPSPPTLVRMPTNSREPETSRVLGLLRPDMRALSTTSPEVVYSLIVPDSKFDTNSREPSSETARSIGTEPGATPVISLASIVSPDVVYSPIVPSTNET